MQQQKHIIFGNYGDNTIALIKWAQINNLYNVYVVSIDTGWAARSWENRVKQGTALACSYGFQVQRLKSPETFPTLVKHRNRFPSAPKFTWCAGFLKGLPFLKWLDEETDPECNATILLGKRRASSQALLNLPEFIENSEFYGDRKVWFPLLNHSDEARDGLVKLAGFELLYHRSLECDPCIHSNALDFARMDTKDITKTIALEAQMSKPMFEKPIQSKTKTKAKTKMLIDKSQQDRYYAERFNQNCGSPYACGE